MNSKVAANGAASRDNPCSCSSCSFPCPNIYVTNSKWSFKNIGLHENYHRLYVPHVVLGRWKKSWLLTLQKTVFPVKSDKTAICYMETCLYCKLTLALR